MGPLVFCPKGHVFESRAIRIENSRNVTLRGNRESCPACGASAEIMDGEFDFLEGTIRVLSTPGLTLDRLRALRTLVEQTPPEKVLDAIREASPELASSIARLLPTDPGKLTNWILVVLAVLTLLIGWKDLEVSEHPPSPAPQQQQLTEQQIEQIVRSIVTSEQSSSQPGQPPGPPVFPPSLRGEPPQPHQRSVTPARHVPAQNKRYTPPKRRQTP